MRIIWGAGGTPGSVAHFIAPDRCCQAAGPDATAFAYTIDYLTRGAGSLSSTNVGERVGVRGQRRGLLRRFPLLGGLPLTLPSPHQRADGERESERHSRQTTAIAAHGIDELSSGGPEASAQVGRMSGPKGVARFPAPAAIVDLVVDRRTAMFAEKAKR